MEFSKKLFNLIKIVSIWSAIIFYCFLLNITRKRYRSLKICICTYGKEENRYVKEFLEHYKNYKVDKIYIYDNNAINGEYFEEVIQKYIKSGFVEIVGWRGKKKNQIIKMNDCYIKNNMNYDWLIFFDFDEFIHLKDFSSIKKYLYDQRFNNCTKIQLNWNMHTDNNLLFYDNRTLSIRFPKNAIKKKKNKGIATIKSIIRGGMKDSEINNMHRLIWNLKGCNGFGKEINDISIYTKDIDNEYYYIDHYYCKSTEEFISKVNKGSVITSQSIENKLGRIKTYIKLNKINQKKAEMIEKNTGINLSNYQLNFG